MRDFLILLVHLIVTVARLAGPGGLRSVVAESALLRLSIAAASVRLDEIEAAGLRPHLVAVESRMDAGTDDCAPPRFSSPLIKPDVPISGIRLSDWFHRETHERDAM